MEQIFNYLQQLPQEFILGYDTRELSRLAQEKYREIAKNYSRETSPRILLAESKQLEFIASFITAVAAESPVFLGNPHWAKPEWQQVFDLVKPELILGKNTHNLNYQLPITNYQLPIPNSPIMIPTGGSSGKIKFAIHTWETLTASVAGFQEYFQVAEINSFCVLPLYHVSGLMQFIRSFITGGKLVILPSYKEIIDNRKWNIEPNEFFISLVPTQLQRLLEIPETANWLSNFKTVLLGGAPAWQDLLDLARKHQIRLAPTYGMTETASQVATLKPVDFLAGNNSSGRILPHARVTIRSESGEILAGNQIGIVTVEAESLAWGYYPELFGDRPHPHPTDDLGYFDDKGFLNIVGRRSGKIITGGENVFPAEVEAAIFATGLVKDICVIGLSDRFWGEIVVAVYVANSSEVSPAVLSAAVSDKLSKFKQPKDWVELEELPRNSQGKVCQQKLKEILQT